MPKALAEVTLDALTLSPRQRIVLAGLLLETAENGNDDAVESTWDNEIRERLRVLDAGQVSGVDYADVSRAAEERLAR